MNDLGALPPLRTRVANSLDASVGLAIASRRVLALAMTPVMPSQMSAAIPVASSQMTSTQSAWIPLKFVGWSVLKPKQYHLGSIFSSVWSNSPPEERKLARMLAESLPT